MTGDAAPRAGSPRLRGLLWAILALAIASAFPVVTRLGVTGQGVTPLQIAVLRYGIAGLILLPVLVMAARSLGPAAWAEGALLAALQGTPLALLVSYALIHTPAAHGSALTLGLMPAAILVVCGLGGARASRNVVLGAAIIAAGALALTLLTHSDGEPLIGHAMLVAAAFLGAGYFVRLRRSGFTALQGAAFVAVFSGIGGGIALLVVEGPGPIAALDARTLLFQATYQGVLSGVVWIVAMNRSIALLGAAPAAVFLSLVPGFAAALAVPALGEVPSLGDALALGTMVAGAVLSASARSAEGVTPLPTTPPGPSAADLPARADASDLPDDPRSVLRATPDGRASTPFPPAARSDAIPA